MNTSTNKELPEVAPAIHDRAALLATLELFTAWLAERGELEDGREAHRDLIDEFMADLDYSNGEG